MNYYISKDDLNMRDAPGGNLLGTMRKGTIVYALGEPFDEADITWVNVFAYDMNGTWYNAYSAIRKGEDVFLEQFVPSAKLLNPYRGDTRLTQLFGENGAPLYKKIGMYGHNGVDFFGNNKSIYAVAPGTVYTAFDESGYGNYIIVTGATLKILYAHLASVNVANGSYVQPGDLIGVEGNTSTSSARGAQHLHIELRPIQNYNGDNGFMGRIDLLPYLDWSNIVFPDYCSILNNFKGK